MPMFDACLSDEAMAAWLASDAAARVVTPAVGHLAACGRCRAIAAALLDGSDDDAPGPRHLGRYVIDGTLAAGAMGIVLHATDPVLARRLAIKVARADGLDDRARQRLLGEAQALARLQHPHVVAVHDAGEVDGEVFVAMALVDGARLPRWLADAVPDVAARGRVLAEVADGLAAIHRAGLVHGDVKPDNVVIDRAGRAIVVDLGLARAVDERRAPGELAGTPGYLAPEVLAGAATSPGSDQFAWGEVVRATMADARLTPRSRRAVAQVVATACAPHAPARFATMAAAGAALAVALAPRSRSLVVATFGVALVAGAVVAALVLQREPAPTADRCDVPLAGWALHDRLGSSAALRRGGFDAPRVRTAVAARAAATAPLVQAACRGDATNVQQQSCAIELWRQTTDVLADLRATDREAQARALDELITVTPVARCLDARPAMAPLPPPASVATTVAELSAQVTTHERLVDRGAALVGLDAMAATVEATGYLPLHARWTFARATVLAELGKFADADAAYAIAMARAEQGGDDDLRARIVINRLKLAFGNGDEVPATQLRDAEALLQRLGNVALQAELKLARAMLRGTRDGEPAAAVTALLEVRDAYAQLALGAHAQQVVVLQDLGGIQQMAGDLDGAQATLDAAVAMATTRHGADAAETWTMRGARATNLMYRDDLAAASDELDRVAAAFARLLPPDAGEHMMLGGYRCQVQVALGRPTAIATCAAALAIGERLYGPAHPQLVWPMAALGRAYIGHDEPAAAVPVLERALAIIEARGGVTTAETPQVQADLAMALHQAGQQPTRAAALAAQAWAGLMAQPNTEETRDILRGYWPELGRLRPPD